MTDTLTLAIVIHLVCDWVFQNHWIAVNKANLRHPAGYIHAMVHVTGLLLILPPGAAFVVGITHLLIDTRKPVQWWMRVYGQTTDGPYAIHVQIWLDQVLHIAVLALVIGLVNA